MICGRFQTVLKITCFMNKRKLGNEKETAACGFLEAAGYRILEQNFYCRAGEIDIIAMDGDILCFIEVKYRSGMTQGGAAAAVTFAKQKAVSKAALFYIMKHNMSTDTAIRFDVVTIDGDMFNIIKNAFDYCYR